MRSDIGQLPALPPRDPAAQRQERHRDAAAGFDDALGEVRTTQRFAQTPEAPVSEPAVRGAPLAGKPGPHAVRRDQVIAHAALSALDIAERTAPSQGEEAADAEPDSPGPGGDDTTPALAAVAPAVPVEPLARGDAHFPATETGPATETRTEIAIQKNSTGTQTDIQNAAPPDARFTERDKPLVTTALPRSAPDSRPADATAERTARAPESLVRLVQVETHRERVPASSRPELHRPGDERPPMVSNALSKVEGLAVRGRAAGDARTSQSAEPPVAATRAEPGGKPEAVAETPTNGAAPSVARQVLDAIEGALRDDSKSGPQEARTLSAPREAIEQPLTRVVRLQLAPQSLGLVHIMITASGPSLRVKIEAEQSDTARWLANDREILVQRLSASDTVVEEMIVSRLDSGDSRASQTAARYDGGASFDAQRQPGHQDARTGRERQPQSGSAAASELDPSRATTELHVDAIPQRAAWGAGRRTLGHV